MKAGEIRDWLGKYFLVTTIVLGGYILLFAGRYTVMLRIDKQTGNDCFQIIIPTLVGQLTVIFRFFGTNQTIDNEAIVPVPSWVVKWPPLLLISLIVVTIVVMALGNLGPGQTWSPMQDQFKLIVTFYVTILNATSVFVVSRFFEASKLKTPSKTDKRKSPVGPVSPSDPD
jgi:hypothetical protein